MSKPHKGLNVNFWLSPDQVAQALVDYINAKDILTRTVSVCDITYKMGGAVTTGKSIEVQTTLLNSAQAQANSRAS